MTVSVLEHAGQKITQTCELYINKLTYANF